MVRFAGGIFNLQVTHEVNQVAGDVALVKKVTRPLNSSLPRSGGRGIYQPLEGPCPIGHSHQFADLKRMIAGDYFASRGWVIPERTGNRSEGSGMSRVTVGGQIDCRAEDIFD